MPVQSMRVAPGPETLSDLVKRIGDRDQAAFGRFYRRLVRAVFTQLSDSLGSPALAVAVTRAVFVEVWQLAPKTLSSDLDGLTWVNDIVARRAADQLLGIRQMTPRLATGPDDCFRSVAPSLFEDRIGGLTQHVDQHTAAGRLPS